MYAADIKGSIAYTKSLTIVGILTKAEEKKIIDGLELVGKEWEEGVVKNLSLQSHSQLSLINPSTNSLSHRKMTKTFIPPMNVV